MPLARIRCEICENAPLPPHFQSQQARSVASGNQPTDHPLLTKHSRQRCDRRSIPQTAESAGATCKYSRIGRKRHRNYSLSALQPADLLQIRSEEHTSELQSLMRISYAVFCLKKKKQKHKHYSVYTT